jgi:putative membrane-bound dehydrogenase-like protein
MSLVVLASASPLFAKTADGKSLAVMIAGKPSHGPGEHEHNAGVQLLAKGLAAGAPNLATKVLLNGEWPDAAILAQADTVLIYSDGGGGHPALKDDRMQQLAKEMKRGCGFVCLHYAVEVPNDNGGPQFLDWLGGYFATDWSVNPHWTANFSELPKHPISNGVKPFSTKDEWYYHMRFRDGMKGVTPILTDLPPEGTLSRPDGHHSGNPAVRAAIARKEKQHVAWAVQREDNGRGFGFTGGHFHSGWANDDQRKLVLNAILWTAKAEVPASGVESKVTEADMQANLDPKAPKKKANTPAAASNDGDPHAKPVFSTDKVLRGPVPIRAEIKGAKELHLVVTDGGDSLTCDWANWINPVLVKADGTKQKLTELDWKNASTGFGQVSKGRNCSDHPLKVRGEQRAEGIGTHAPSLISFALPEGVVAFEAEGAIDDGGYDQNGGASVTFQVFTTKPGGALLEKTEKTKAAPAVPYGFAEAKARMSQFKTADGLAVSLWAAEPMIQNPTNIDVDERGRIWATEAVNYRSTFRPWKTLREEGDRVVILEDKNGDGEADLEKTFWQSKDLQAPLGILVLPQDKGTKVIVSAAPNIWLLTDADGDDKAEKADLLFKVGGNWDHDHEVHAFVFGVDGKFYFNFGNEGKKLMWPDGSVVTDLAGRAITDEGKPYRQGMIFRCDIDLATAKASNVETLGHNFRNNYEVAVDSFGTMWQSDNDDDGNKGVRINYVMEYGNYGYTDEMTGAGWRTKRTNMETEIPKQHWYQNDPGSMPNLLQTGGGSPTGILINESPALGPQFENQMIHCDAGPRAVRAYPVRNDGAGYSATMVDILTSEDPWYRVADVGIAPDGSLIVADWYDAGVGGHNMADNTKGNLRGRIYRVAPTGKKLNAPKLDFSSAKGCIGALQSPNRAAMYIAWRKLAAMGAKAEQELAALWKESANPRMRARALALLVQLPEKRAAYLKAGLGDQNSDIRIAAIRLTALLAKTAKFDTSVLEEDKQLVGALMKDPNPQVRRQIATALHGAKDIAKLWAALAMQHDGKDRWYLEALGIGAAGNEDECFDAWFAMAGGNWNTPAGRDIIWRLRSAKSAAYLAKLIEDENVAAAEKPRYLRAFDFLPKSSGKTKALVELATTGKAADDLAREALVRLKGTDLNAEPSVAAALQATVEKAKGTPQFVELVRDFGLKKQGSALLDTALKLSADPIAVDAVRLIFDDADSAQIFDAALAKPNASAVIDLLGNTATGRGLARLTALVGGADQKTELRQQAVRALARTQPGAEQLLKLAGEGKFPDDLKFTAAGALALVQYAKLKDAIAQHFPMPNALGGKPLPPIGELVKIKGDIAKGKAVYERVESSCVTCHRVGDKGVDFGPGLSEIGSKLPKEALYEAIINPNAGVSMGFETWQLSLKDGGAAMGIIRSETNDEVVLALPGGAATKIAKQDIAKREKLANSLMPSGLNQALAQADLIDLVEYLASLKAK